MAAARRPRPVQQDARGILDPEAMARVVRLERYPAGGELEGLVTWFWAVRWALPPGLLHEQRLITHPGANLSVGHTEPVGEATEPGPVTAELHGVYTRLGVRRLAGSGWAVAALLAPGGLGAVLPGPAGRTTDRVLPLEEGLAERWVRSVHRLVARMSAAHGDDPDAVERRRVELLRDLLERVVGAADPARVAAARQVAAVARLAETDRSIDRLEQLAAAAGVTPRTLQRLFAEHAGVPVTWVLRRYRIIEAAELARTGGGRPWAELAVDLGYSDQAHLIRDFRAHVGTTPAAYAARQQSARG